ncbi:hypothetical protein KBI52_18230 [Microvirga sp. HBU67558]|uniref:hypothetical protein n=1 Tax=Microvirga TaxID=186650 RepID=UPI001B37AFF1|nr:MULTISPECIES: hypothetical protein [unclassified Microvirga]MBQ0822131.1 hypothetical protein [Microvirga sp. HBU67558]
MAETVTRRQLMLARLVVILASILVVLGLFLYGLSADVSDRVWRDIASRPGGPMTFRFILQPCMAAIAAFHDGAKDARLGRSPYLWSLLTSPTESSGRLGEGLIATARIILLGLAMDAVYQATVLKTFYPGEMVLIAILLAFLPYVLLRGPFARLVRWWSRSM